MLSSSLSNGRWWLIRAWTILGQNFASLAYSSSFKPYMLQYTAVSRKVVLQMGKAYATMSKVIMGNSGFYCCLIWTSRCFSVVEGNSTNTCDRSFSFLVTKSPWTFIKQNQTLTTHNTNRHCRFYTFVGQSSLKQLHVKSQLRKQKIKFFPLRNLCLLYHLGMPKF